MNFCNIDENEREDHDDDDDDDEEKRNGTNEKGRDNRDDDMIATHFVSQMHACDRECAKRTLKPRFDIFFSKSYILYSSFSVLWAFYTHSFIHSFLLQVFLLLR